jgi:Tfp pilus assembly protein PilN
MRPVNLIPTEQRHGQRASMRSGPVAYIVIGALLAALAGVTLLVITGNQISDRKTEIVQLEQQDAVAKARAAKLDAYTQFHSVHDQRVATVTSLADSRFDWERVMRELALVLPGDVWLTNLTGTDAPGVAPDGAASVSLRSSIPGPALELIGCARSQDAVAGFVQALKDIDGVTRVGVQSSALGSESSESGGGSVSSGSAAPSSGGGASSCQTRDFIAQFQIVAAFDAAPVASEASASTEAAAAPAPAPVPAPESTTTSTESGEG